MREQRMEKFPFHSVGQFSARTSIRSIQYRMLLPLSHGRSVCVCLLMTSVNCSKAAEPIEM